MERGDGWVCAALSDGAGSKRFGKEGAEIVTTYLAKNLHTLIANELAQGVSKRSFLALKSSIIEALLQEVGEDYQEFSATVLFAYYGCDRWLIGHLGDGVIGGLVDGKIKLLSAPQKGEFANETYFFTSSDAIERMRLFVVRRLDGVVLMSDGLERALYDPKERRLGAALERLFAWQKKLGEDFDEVLQRNLDEVLSTRSSDDCAIYFMQRVG